MTDFKMASNSSLILLAEIENKITHAEVRSDRDIHSSVE